ncbi:Uncharacterised protein [BD1-7 clade bacterium]|uniref:Porin domain-containing protein n=1 Tax=BD1-7 clade bacterium TaxID=2029982 RepID=A0A5S9QWJ4_9GAMM|nr:Uncharacterised protein [BD1-7 clade bacterium]CAA0122350.1 Uncharacterised protein [BD1-7 clade bacterium]CAA0122873.1 Uncharacterised protein [BD1-7 clade bacterium]
MQTTISPYLKKTCKGLLAAGLMGAAALPASAGAKIEFGDDKWVSIGAGFRASFNAVENGSPNGESYSKDFTLNNMRLYLGGQIAEGFKATFNTEYIDDEIKVLDAIAQYEPMDEFNIWFGRMLTPADRIEMNGPFYGLTWNQYTVPLFPSDQGGEAGRYGRDNGVTVWGSAGKFQYAVGAFSGYKGASNGDSSLLYATRLAYNFLNMEKNPGYYTSSTYYGKAGDIFTIGFSAQTQSGGTGTEADSRSFTGYALDVFFEKVLGDAGVLTMEGEYKVFDADLPAAARNDADCFCLFNGDSFFVTAAYLVPPTGPGSFQPYVRYTSNNADGPTPASDGKSDLTELGVNYVLQGHNLRLNFNATSGDANASGFKAAESVNSFTFGLQYQI